MLLWMLLLALPLQAFASAGLHAAHAQHRADVQPCQTAGQAHHDDAPHDGTHAADGACVACCPAAVPALSQSVPAFDVRRGPVAYAQAYLPWVIPEPPEHPPRVLSI